MLYMYLEIKERERDGRERETKREMGTCEMQIS